MEKQLTFADLEHESAKRKTKRDKFLEEMNRTIPWEALCAVIEPYYFKNKKGRPAKGIEKMLRMYLLQIWFSLSDEGLEDAIYDSLSMQKFMGISLMYDGVPDATTLLKFRRIIEKNKLGEKIFNTINGILEDKGKIMHGGTIVDATIINAPSSTKNELNERDGEMHSTKKGNQWYFGMKAHVGVDAGTGLVHTVTATSANVHDIDEAHNLVREDDDVVYGDAGYVGIEKRNEITSDEHLNGINWRIGKRPGNIKKMRRNLNKWCDAREEYLKAKTRCKVEHVFQIMKCIFGFRKVCYKGIEKNLNRLFMIFSQVNILKMARIGVSLK